jgi:hypothetical protein
MQRKFGFYTKPMIEQGLIFIKTSLCDFHMQRASIYLLSKDYKSAISDCQFMMNCKKEDTYKDYLRVKGLALISIGDQEEGCRLLSESCSNGDDNACAAKRRFCK